MIAIVVFAAVCCHARSADTCACVYITGSKEKQEQKRHKKKKKKEKTSLILQTVSKFTFHLPKESKNKVCRHASSMKIRVFFMYIQWAVLYGFCCVLQLCQ